MATSSNLEDSFQSALDYEAEVAYISLTSPLSLKEQTSEQRNEDEFDFSTEQEQDDFSSSSAGVEEGTKDEEGLDKTNGEITDCKPPLMSKVTSPRPSLTELLPQPPLVEISPQPSLAEISPQACLSLTGKVQLSEQTRQTKSLSSLALPEKARQPRISLSSLAETDYALDIDPPTTPRSQLRRIQEAQAPPSPKVHPKLEQEQHLYCTLVVYGSSGCGRTHLVDKLALSNPSIFSKVVPTTTRKKRSNEVSGVDFHYLSHKEMRLGLDRGDFIESIRVHRRGGKDSPLQRRGGKDLPLQRRIVKQQASLHMSPAPLQQKTSPDTPPPSTHIPPVDGDKKYGSLFDLTEEDSPVLGGEMFGTSYQAITEATQQSKPCILLNVSTRGAYQLKNVSVRASYVLVQNETSTGSYTPKGRHASKVKQSENSPKGELPLIPDYTISFSSLDQAYSDLHQYAMQLVCGLKLPNTSQYQETKYEWDTLPTIEFEQSDSQPHRQLGVPVTFSELLAHFNNTNLKKQIDEVRRERTKSRLFSPARLTKRLQNEKLMVQAIVYYKLSNKERLHLRMLQTVYSQLTGNKLSCRRFGTHWQEIGFSGVDPADDMQQVGLLGISQLIYFMENSRTALFCKEIFQYCHKDTHIIPFTAMAFEFTQLSLATLESGALNKICNKRDQVFVVLNEFYMAAFHHYYQTWKSSQKSILQLGLLMQQCGDYCKGHPHQVMQAFDQHLSIREPQNQLLPALLPKMEKAFTPFNTITTSI